MSNYRKLTRRTARRYGVNPNVAERQVGLESGFNPDAVSPAGAVGLDQLMPGTARELGVRNSRDPRQNLEGGMKYLRQLLDRFHGNYRQALAGYNAGPGNLKAGYGYADKILGGKTPTAAARATPALQRGGNASSPVGSYGGVDRRSLALSLLGFGQVAGDSGEDPLTAALTAAVKGQKSAGRAAAPTTPTSYGGGSSGGGRLLAKLGPIIGTPYKGTHDKGFNQRGGSDNWQSENADDIRVPVGTPVYAIEDGVLGNTGSLGSGGRFAGLRTNLVGKHNSYYYAHLSKLAPGIRAGAHVKKGQLLGLTGEANGVPHLHFAAQHGNPGRYVK